MDQHLKIVMLLTIGFSLASVLGYFAQRIRLPSILGYLVAGYLIGPYSPGFEADLKISEQLAEIGVILMLFGVGMHFKWEDLALVKNIAIPGALGQTFAAALLTTWLVYSLGWSIEVGIILGVAIGVASTVVLMRVLSDNHLLETPEGHIAVGWLIVEDILTVGVLIMLPLLAASLGGQAPSFLSILSSIFLALGKFLLLVFLMFTWGFKAVTFILMSIARLRSQELFTIAIVALIFVIATGSALIFGTSIALGAFIAGMVIGKTHLRHQASANALPLKDIFAVVFFLSVGMLFNPLVMVDNSALFFGLMSVIFIGKPLAAFLIVMGFGYSLKTALTISLALAQIGEFSFILAEEAMNLNLLPDEGYDVLVACAMISISINPLLFQTIDYIESKIRKSDSSPKLLKIKQPLSPKVVIVGFGPIGQEVVQYSKAYKFTPIIIDHNIDTVANLDDEEVQIIFGDASQPDILKSAHIETASLLVITVPDSPTTIEIVHAARTLNPNLKIVARIAYLSEQQLMENLDVSYICSEKEALTAFKTLIRSFMQKVKI